MTSQNDLIYELNKAKEYLESMPPNICEEKYRRIIVSIMDLKKSMKY